MSKFKAIIFDLDDTLIDTYKYRLIPALKNSWKALHQVGLALSESEFLETQKKFSKESPKANFFQHISLVCPDPKEAQRLAEDAFYGFELKKSVRTFDGVLPLLVHLQGGYQLYLVTAGQPETQREKIKLAGLTEYFLSTEFVDYRTGQTKKTAMEKILQTNQLKPKDVLCVGNRLDDEIKAANALGIETCLLNYGEHIHQTPDDETGHPTHQISHISELISRCHL